jgi:alpha-aminoadipic semialdehyde synthase
MFSHTAKGQPYNTGLLSQFVAPTDGVLAPSAAEFEKILELWPRLIDYELLTDEKGKRTVGFGWYAGGELPLLILPCIHSGLANHF